MINKRRFRKHSSIKKTNYRHCYYFVFVYFSRVLLCFLINSIRLIWKEAIIILMELHKHYVYSIEHKGEKWRNESIQNLDTLKEQAQQYG